MSRAGDVVKRTNGETVPSQRLASGDLAFLAQNVPALAGRRYVIAAGKAQTVGSARAEGNTVATNGLIVKVDPTSGAIVSLKAGEDELVDSSAAIGLNSYIYLPGGNVADAQSNGPVQVRIIDAGPLVATLEVIGDAPGCHRLGRQIRVVDGLDHVVLANVVDKKAVREKEGVHFGFGFRVPQGVVRMDVPWAVVRPEVDQLPGACKNWFTVQRFVDISNDRAGVTLATVDAPLLEVGGLTANLPGQQPRPECFLDRLDPSQTIYSWVMNNHWYTNYKADQEGPTLFRYAIHPHGVYDPATAERFGIEQSQPLQAAAARGNAPSEEPFLSVEPAGVLVTSIQPVEDGKLVDVRLFNASGKEVRASLHRAKTDTGSGSTEQSAAMAPWAIATLRMPAAP
jgi:hypothetical protein